MSPQNKVQHPEAFEFSGNGGWCILPNCNEGFIEARHLSIHEGVDRHGRALKRMRVVNSIPPTATETPSESSILVPSADPLLESHTSVQPTGSAIPGLPYDLLGSTTIFGNVPAVPLDASIVPGQLDQQVIQEQTSAGPTISSANLPMPEDVGGTGRDQAFVAATELLVDELEDHAELATADITSNEPRAVLSDESVRRMLWFADTNGGFRIPTLSQLQRSQKQLHARFGLKVYDMKGRLGDHYSMLKPSEIIAQEFRNPLVRPLLSFYPHGQGKRITRATEAHKWRHEVPGDELTPVYRRRSSAGLSDFYVYELALLQDRTGVVPIRWYTDDIPGETSTVEMFFEAYRAVVFKDPETGELGWEVLDGEVLNLRAADLMLNHLDMEAALEGSTRLPSPKKIIGSRSSDSAPRVPWNRPYINPWRTKARGRMVYGVPVWLYCDDTSGNDSKMWNKHDSIYITLAGLPPKVAQQEYHIHFVSTSNIAPPLELLEGTQADLKKSFKNGVEAWDCISKEDILFRPFALGFQGDNPMQAEFTCQIGLAANLFCRVCWIGENPGLDSAATTDNPNVDGDQDEEVDDNPTPDQDDSTFATKGPGYWRAYIHPGRPRTPAETIQHLRDQQAQAEAADGRTRFKRLQTATGLGDKHLAYFNNKLIAATKQLYDMAASRKKAAYRDAQESAEQGPRRTKGNGPGLNNSDKLDLHRRTQAALDDLKESFGFDFEEQLNPAFNLDNFDPHADSPVEILHTVLLGFVKYLWRDAVDQQQRNGTTGLLIQRLRSFEIEGLGLGRKLRDNLVTYAKSLQGKHFKGIMQVGNIVLHGLIPEVQLSCWRSLGQLAPLIWHHEVEDVDEFSRSLTSAVSEFLHCILLANPGWFCKKKYHILVHLATHIARFGPAYTFATEKFESYNSILRSKSVHSNRQAPSRDIAQAFAHSNRCRHLLSGGYVRLQDGTWRTIGPAAESLVESHCRIMQSFGWTEAPELPPFTTDKRSKPQTHTVASWTRQHPDAAASIPPNLSASSFTSCYRLISLSKDPVAIGDHVLLRSQPVTTFREHSEATPFSQTTTTEPAPPELSGHTIGRIIDILEVDPSSPDAPISPGSNLIFVEQYRIGPDVSPAYKMPLLRVVGKVLLPVTAVICPVNAPHNCAQNNCKATRSVVRPQERQASEKRDLVLDHINPHDRIFNTASLRNSTFLQPLRPTVLPRPEAEILRQAADQVLHLQQEKENLQAKKRRPRKSAGSSTANTPAGGQRSRSSSARPGPSATGPSVPAVDSGHPAPQRHGVDDVSFAMLPPARQSGDEQSVRWNSPALGSAGSSWYPAGRDQRSSQAWPDPQSHLPMAPPGTDLYSLSNTNHHLYQPFNHSQPSIRLPPIRLAEHRAIARDDRVGSTSSPLQSAQRQLPDLEPNVNRHRPHPMWSPPVDHGEWRMSQPNRTPPTQHTGRQQEFTATPWSPSPSGNQQDRPVGFLTPNQPPLETLTTVPPSNPRKRTGDWGKVESCMGVNTVRRQESGVQTED